MKKKNLFVAGLVLVGAGAMWWASKSKEGEKKPQASKPKRESQPTETSVGESEDYIDVLRKEDPLEAFEKRRKLYVLSHIQATKNEEERKEWESYYINDLGSDINDPSLISELNKIPEYDEESGERSCRLYALLGQSRDAFCFSVLDAENLDNDAAAKIFQKMNKLDGLIAKWKHV